MRRFVVLAFPILAACGNDSEEPASTPVGSCTGILASTPDDGGQHVPIGTEVDYATNPPATGPHYPVWARWDREYLDIDRRYWMHNVEHGAIVLLWNCPDGPCDDIVEGLRTKVRERPADPACADQGNVYNRMIVAQDKLLPEGVKVAAVAWGITYTDSCIDPYLQVFVTQRYNHSPEDTCAEGIELGGTFIEQASP